MKAQTSNRKLERLEARVTKQQKEFFVRAAKLQGRTLTDFIVNSLQEAARRIVEENQVISLTRRDQEIFVNALLHPPEPSPRLTAAARRYRKRLAE